MRQADDRRGSVRNSSGYKLDCFVTLDTLNEDTPDHAGIWRGIPFHIQRALTHQVAFDSESEGHIPGTHETPDYSLVTVHDGDIVIHQSSFLYDGPSFHFTTQKPSSPSRLANWLKPWPKTIRGS